MELLSKAQEWEIKEMKQGNEEKIRQLLEEYVGLKDRKAEIKKEIAALTGNKDYKDDKFSFKKTRYFSGYNWQEMPEELIHGYEEVKGKLKDVKKIMLSYAIYRPLFYVHVLKDWKPNEPESP